MEVKKCDGSFEEFNPLKVKKGICEAFESIKEDCPDGLIDSAIKSLFIYDKISSSEIRRQVEEVLMSVNIVHIMVLSLLLQVTIQKKQKE